MMTDTLPKALADWREAPRVRAMNDREAPAKADYVLCWLQQALRAHDNPVIDAAVRLGNAMGLPVLVYHGLREDYPYASDRLHRFILGASRDLGKGCRQRGLACVHYVDRSEKREKGLVYRLAARAAAVVLEDQPAFVAQWQAERVADKVDRPVYAVNAACTVPPAALAQDIRATSAFRRRHEAVREDWYDWHDEEPERPPYDGALPYTPDDLATMDDAALDALVASLAIDHDLPPVARFPATRAAVTERLQRLAEVVLPRYADARGDASRADGASELSPYLHFGMVGPREIVAAVRGADVSAEKRGKYLDELLTWREWFHYKARRMRVPESYARLPDWARRELAEHAQDERPNRETLHALVHGETDNESWNACQKQFLLDGWMHNNVRMFWAKWLIQMTPSPEEGWATACYLNDRFSLDGRDPSTYGNIAWAFGDSAPGYGRRPIYGLVAYRTDASIRKQKGGPAWLAEQAARPAIKVHVPRTPPKDPYLSEKVPI
ncbi:MULTISPECIES: deoxyribodipyrimidine photo-lyase [unclassified Sphingomonas]|uniref:deoxyribodipyrimidine photo-lyase n=2 Tax=Pseudomonadota TaxID=1224 RepID=UPI000E101659|nr:MULTISPECIES: deoxyribodipyrimidine photo-lyase [unclassified Sphingomonas]AXJ96982.1 DNA photolyase [Sphingomonas sp. FARSPH]